MYQSKEPNDIGLFKKITEKFKNNNIDILLKTELVRLEYNNTNITRVIVKKDKVYFDVYAKNFILAIPVTNLLKILNDSKINNSFGDYNSLISWNNRNSYDTYITIIFHWDTKLLIKDKWGIYNYFIYMILSDYMEFNESETVISFCFIKVDNSLHNLNLEELLYEAYRRLTNIIPNLPKPDKSILYPGVYKKNGKWISKESAYMRTVDSMKGYPIKFRSNIFNNLYSVGSHNGQTKFDFTSMESAVTNGMIFCNKIGNKKYNIKSPTDVSCAFKLILLLLMFFIITKKR